MFITLHIGKAKFKKTKQNKQTKNNTSFTQTFLKESRVHLISVFFLKYKIMNIFIHDSYLDLLLS